MSNLSKHIQHRATPAIVGFVGLALIAIMLVAFGPELTDYAPSFFISLFEREPVIGLVNDQLSSLPEVRFEQVTCTGPVQYEKGGVSC